MVDRLAFEKQVMPDALRFQPTFPPQNFLLKKMRSVERVDKWSQKLQAFNKGRQTLYRFIKDIIWGDQTMRMYGHFTSFYIILLWFTHNSESLG